MSTEFNRDSFILYRSFVDIIRELDDADAKAFILAISDYALNGNEPQLDGMLSILWMPVKPQLDANIRRYKNGKKGGAPKGSRNNPNGRRGQEINLELTEDKPTANQKVSLVTRPERVCPTIEQVREYIVTNNLSVDPDIFFDYYESRGWKSGNADIYNWQALVRTWVNRSQQQNNKDPELGVGEYYDSDGNRRYDSSEVIIPTSAPPRPSKKHWWNEITTQWESLI